MHVVPGRLLYDPEKHAFHHGGILFALGAGIFGSAAIVLLKPKFRGPHEPIGRRHPVFATARRC